MADNVNVAITGARDLGLRFDTFPREARAKLITVISELTETLEGRIIAAMPQGKTGRLKASVIRQMFNDNDKITGRVVVDADFAKAGALEYGGTGAEFTVRAHPARLDHVFAQRLATPLSVFVQEHSRAIHTTAKRFIRGPAQSMQAAAIADMREAIESVEDEQFS